MPRKTQPRRCAKRLLGVALLGIVLPAVVLASPAQLRERLLDAIDHSATFKDRFTAEVWLVDMAARLQDKIPDWDVRLDLLRKIHAEATRSRLAPEVVLAVIEVESNFDRWAISRSGARGLMQIMPFWLTELGRPSENLFDVDTNLRLGCTILRYYLDEQNDNLMAALSRYNGNENSRLYAEKVMTALERHWYRQ